MWVLYKKILTQVGDLDRRDLLLAQNAFYTGARGILKILAYLTRRGDYDQAHSIIERHGRQIERLLGRPPRKRHH
jgi:hypothetical protein